MEQKKKSSNCPVCDKKNALDFFSDPIGYWGCNNCTTVFVMGRDGTINCLDERVEYRDDNKGV